MNKKLAITLVLVTMILGGAVALALAGSLQDPLISLDYLQNRYKASVLSEVDKEVNDSHAKSYDEAVRRLDAEAARFRAQLGGASSTPEGSYLDRFTPKKYSFGDTITLQSGSGLLCLEGTAEAHTQNGELIDVTRGSAATSVSLEPGSRYLAGESATVTVTIQSEAAILAPVGFASQAASGQTAMPFTDLSRNAWYYSSVQFAYQKKMFNGVSENHFAPSGVVTRAMLSTVLYRLAGAPSVQGTGTQFTDVAVGAWYDAGVRWSAETGIVKGMGDGSFAPNANVSREQLAAMLYRYAREYAKLGTNEVGDLGNFTDNDAISAWAEDGLSWAVGAGVLNGDPSGALNPGASASRVEAATMLQRFSKLLA